MLQHELPTTAVTAMTGTTAMTAMTQTTAMTVMMATTQTMPVTATTATAATTAIDHIFAYATTQIANDSSASNDGNKCTNA